MTPTPTPSGSAERGPRTDVRAKVLQAAVQLVHERGLQAVTQARVAEVAGLRQSHVTYYFPSRLDLVKAIVQEHVSALLDGVDSTNATPLRKFRDVMIERVKRRESPRMMLALLLASDEDPELRSWLRAFEIEFRARIEQACKVHGLSPAPTDIDDFHAAVTGATMLGMHDDSPEGSRRAVRTVRNAFQRLIDNARRPAMRGARRR